MTGALVGESGTLDPSYWAKLNFIQKPHCACCGTPFVTGNPTDPPMVCGQCLQEPPDFTTARAALKYDDASADMVLRFKYSDATHLSRLFANLLRQTGDETLGNCDVILSVPLHRWRLLKRRYNQAALIAESLSKLTHMPHWPLALTRVKSTESQGHKTKSARIENVRGAFQVSQSHADRLRYKKVVLIDDVMTSGATLNTCTRALSKAGVSEVHVLTVCRVVKSD